MRTDGRQWVPEDVQGQYNQYNYNVEKANQLMKDAGFTKEGGTWRTPDGNPTSLNLLTGGETVQVESVIISQLKDFGIDVSLKKQGETTVSNRIDQGDFQLTLQSWPTNPQGL